MNLSFFCFYFQLLFKVIILFYKEDEFKSNEQKINDLMGGVKKIIVQLGKWGVRSEEEKERLMYCLVRLKF